MVFCFGVSPLQHQIKNPQSTQLISAGLFTVEKLDNPSQCVNKMNPSRQWNGLRREMPGRLRMRLSWKQHHLLNCSLNFAIINDLLISEIRWGHKAVSALIG
ncbi:uncharacterized protein LOC144328854 isoform X2 [Podarcis muralis]